MWYTADSIINLRVHKNIYNVLSYGIYLKCSIHAAKVYLKMPLYNWHNNPTQCYILKIMKKSHKNKVS